jgi:hypothetical protein
MLLLIASIVGVLCAIFGVYKFTGDYTCRVVGFNSKLKNGCVKIAWLPSACVVAFVLGLAVMRSSPFGQMMG